MALLTEADLGKFFGSFSASAFRFETRDRYISTVGKTPFQKYLAGEPDDHAWHRGWMEMLSRDVAVGKTWRRVRIVSVPLSDYNRYSIGIGRLSVRAGEEIRYLTREAARALSLAPLDAWLFDSRVLVHLHFYDDDTFREAEVVEDQGVVDQHLMWRDLAWQQAIPLEDFAAAYS
ncbi:hypothetical protein RB614_00900 [Phytohabitans sp. ZYX-F-186]|uniref:DUF6879 domain-containing protein n=1 Tax=Phytohabitans maris TaxID=3071409 RepID=A0ABU0Z7P0_9ACTN|nr:DUF6879 family protein [Phytohabitans sp. ZYX-F-186]MDQ7903078.1 hypothetical protein [Phytohabitans sp. ZYX-F-186]